MPSVAALLAEIATIGRDPATGGYRRMTLTREDAALGEWFAAACAARDLDVTTDRNGNQWAWWSDPDTEAGIVTGSHLDSVPDGGAFDGPLGVAAALVAVDHLRAQGFQPRRPIGVVRFLDEEGGRFGLACSGSRLLTGAARPERVLALRDEAGTSYAEAAAAAGLDVGGLGRDDEALRRIGTFIEVHVEQGKALATEQLDAPIGIGSAIRPHGRWRLDLVGRADHAGTTQLVDRRDPMLELARFISAVRIAAENHAALATVGKVAVRPNAVNAIPSSVSAWLDARADREEQVDAVLSALAEEGFEPLLESWTGSTDFDPALATRLSELAGGCPVLRTGAGHDAGVLAQAGVKTAMIFARNPSGVSHSPAEFADAEDCERAAEFLAVSLVDLAG